MQNFHSLLICFAMLAMGCSKPVPDARERWGQFKPGELIKYEFIDYTKTPVYQHIADENGLYPEFEYMNKVEVYGIGYISDSLLVTGLMVKPKSSGPHPCVIFNRGGNRELGSLIVHTAVMAMAPLAANGYIVIASNYRGNSGSEGMEEFGGVEVNDVLNLVPALAHIDDADTNRLGVVGVSRGGMMTYLALKTSAQFEAAVVWAGMANLFTMKENRPHMEEHVYTDLIPQYETNMDAALKDRSVVFWPEKLSRNTPLLFMHGTADERVSHDEAEELADKLQALNHPFQFISYKGDNHDLKNHREEAMRMTLNWLNKYLRDGEEFEEVESIVIVP